MSGESEEASETRRAMSRKELLEFVSSKTGKEAYKIGKSTMKIQGGWLCYVCGRRILYDEKIYLVWVRTPGTLWAGKSRFFVCSDHLLLTKGVNKKDA